MNNTVGCPLPQYADKAFLSAKDIVDIMGMKRSCCYEFLGNAPFRAEKKRREDFRFRQLFLGVVLPRSLIPISQLSM